jgi:RND superfamily putative drug exporter
MSVVSWIVRHRRWVYVFWLMLVLAGFAVGGHVFSRLTSDVGGIPGSESAVAAARLQRLAPTGNSIYAAADGRSVTDPRLRSSVAAVAARVRAMPGVANEADPWSAHDPMLVSKDRRAIAIAVTLRPDLTASAYDHTVHQVAAALRTIDAPQVLVGGGALQDQDAQRQAQADLKRAEMFGLPAVLILLLVIFRGVTAALMPLAICFSAVGVSLLALLAASHVTVISVYAVNLITMLGLGLAVDYALLMVSRFRDERREAPDVATAVMRATMSAGRTVGVSGLVVTVSLGGLLAFRDPFLRSMGIAGACVVALDMLAALTLLPAMLASFGHRIKPARAEPGRPGAFAALARFAQRRAVPVAVLSSVGLAVLAVPFLGARYADADARSLPKSSVSRQLADLAQTRFGQGIDVEPVVVLANVPPGTPESSSYIERLGKLPGVTRVGVRDGIATFTVVELTPAGTTQGPAAQRVVREVRHTVEPFRVQVTGKAASLVDYDEQMSARLPWAICVVALGTFLLLFAFTGSVVIPVKALLMNMLSLGASFGSLVWVFQDGHLANLLGTVPLGSLHMAVPALVFAIAFGLSMDYEVFLLGSIREAHLATGDTSQAVVAGIRRTGRIVTSAAALIVTVFAGYVAGGYAPIKEVGLGLGLAVLLDATIVRMLLLPATMTLLGRWNWWAPAPMRRWHRSWTLRLSSAPISAEAASSA